MEGLTCGLNVRQMCALHVRVCKCVGRLERNTAYKCILSVKEHFFLCDAPVAVFKSSTIGSFFVHIVPVFVTKHSTQLHSRNHTALFGQCVCVRNVAQCIVEQQPSTHDTRRTPYQIVYIYKTRNDFVVCICGGLYQSLNY